MTLHEVELVEAVAALREQLVEAAAAGAGAELTFGVKELTLEFTVELRKDAHAKGGFKAWVVSGEATAGLARHSTQRITLTLEPVHHATSGRWEIGNTDAPDLGAFERSE